MRSKVTVYLALLLAAVACALILLHIDWNEISQTRKNGGNFGGDFMSVYAASELTLSGNPAAAYDLGKMKRAEVDLTGQTDLPWSYPPTTLLLIAPLSYLPYFGSLVIWLAIPLAILTFLVRTFFRWDGAIFLVPLYPGVLQCLFSGQNGIISASLLIATLLHIDRRPLTSGIVLGFLTYKPQIAITVFLILFLTRKWRTLLSALATVAGLVIVSVLIFGLAPWRGFFSNLTLSSKVMYLPDPLWDRMVTVFTSARLAGIDIIYAWVLQGFVSVSVIWALWWIWSRPCSLEIRGVALATCIPLVVPYLFDYDLAILILPVVWLLANTPNLLKRPIEIAILIVTFGTPMAAPYIAHMTGIQLTPIILILLLSVIWHRKDFLPPLALAQAAEKVASVRR